MNLPYTMTPEMVADAAKTLQTQKFSTPITLVRQTRQKLGVC